MNLTQKELPDEKPIFIRQIGLEKPRNTPAFVHLLLKTIFTSMAFVTVRQHRQKLKEALKRGSIAQGIGVSTLQIAYASTMTEEKRKRKNTSCHVHNCLPENAIDYKFVKQDSMSI